MKRLMFEGPNWEGHWTKGDDPRWVRHYLRISMRPFIGGGHGGDEYGNCSLYLRTPFFGVVWFYGRHFQQDAEVPPHGECKRCDRVFYQGWEER